MTNELFIFGCGGDTIRITGDIDKTITANKVGLTRIYVSPGITIEADYTLNGKWVFNITEKPTDKTCECEVIEVGEMPVTDCEQSSGGVRISHPNEEYEFGLPNTTGITSQNS